MNKFIHQDGLIISDKKAFGYAQHAIYQNLLRFIDALTRNYGVIADLTYNNSINSSDLLVVVDAEKEEYVTYGIYDGSIIDKNSEVIRVSTGNTASFNVSSGAFSSNYVHIKQSYYYASNGSSFMPGYPRTSSERKIYRKPKYSIVLKNTADNDGTCIAKITTKFDGIVYHNSNIVDMRIPFNMTALPNRHRQNYDVGTSHGDFYAYNNSATAKTPFIHRDNMLPSAVSSGYCDIRSPQFCKSLSTDITNVSSGDYIYLAGSDVNYNVLRVSSVDGTSLSVTPKIILNESSVYYSIIPKRYSHELYKLFRLGLIGTSIVELYSMHYKPERVTGFGYLMYGVEDIEFDDIEDVVKKIENVNTSINMLQGANVNIVAMYNNNAMAYNYAGTPKTFSSFTDRLLSERIITSTENISVSATETATKTKGAADDFFAVANSIADHGLKYPVFKSFNPADHDDLTVIFHSAYVSESLSNLNIIISKYKDTHGILNTAQENYLINSCTSKGTKLYGLYNVMKSHYFATSHKYLKKVFMVVGAKELSNSITANNLAILNYDNVFSLYDGGLLTGNQMNTLISDPTITGFANKTKSNGTIVNLNNVKINNFNNVSQKYTYRLLSFSPDKVKVHAGRLILNWDEPNNKTKIKQYKVKIMKISQAVDLDSLMLSLPSPEDMRKRFPETIAMEYPVIYADRKARKLNSINVIYDSGNDSTIPATKLEMYVQYGDKLLIWIAPVSQYIEGDWSDPINIDVNTIRMVNGNNLTLRNIHDKIEAISRRKFTLLEMRILNKLNAAIRALQLSISDKITQSELEDLT